ncbi:MAG: hypothetical protein ACM3XM_01505 [Mycobacterium leprae]
MQALTVAIGPAGIEYFARQLVAQELVGALGGLKPPDRSIPVGSFSESGPGWVNSYSNVRVDLSHGILSGYTPVYQSVKQQPQGKFLLAMDGRNCTASYDWRERYHCDHSYSGGGHTKEDVDETYDYKQGISDLATTVTLGFVYDQKGNDYAIDVLGSSGQSSQDKPNIPSQSILHGQSNACYTTTLSQATTDSVAAIDFSTPIAQLLPPLLESIPASGDLGHGIAYEYLLGDAGLTFPQDNGIAIGVTGRVSYSGQYYSGQTPPVLPVPPVPSSPNHLMFYLSDYEINALQWAFYQAGLLNTTVNPDDLPDPDVLKVKTYYPQIPAFKPYTAYAMQAQLTPKAAPVVTFAQVYRLTKSVMTLLQQQLPAPVYQQILGLDGNAYACVADLETDLTDAGVAQTYWGTIEQAAREMGLVLAQNLEFRLTIQNGAAVLPYLTFDVVRTDILDNLALGVSGQAQTLQYGFVHAKYSATFVATNIVNFDQADFGSFIWPVVGEPQYDKVLVDMGQTGVPLPMMAGFHFLFQQAQVSIQQGYVSVLAQVEYKA